MRMALEEEGRSKEKSVQKISVILSDQEML